MLYNILLPINQYSGNNTINVMSDIRESQWLFHQMISSYLKVIASALSIASDLLDIFNPHEYTDIYY